MTRARSQTRARPSRRPEKRPPGPARADGTPSEVLVRGRPRPVAGPVHPRSSFGQRYLVVRNTDGHQVLLGLAWFVALMVGFALDWWVVAALYGVAAGWAGLELAQAWRTRRASAGHVLTAGIGATVVGVSGAYGTGAVGLAVLAAVVGAVAVCAAGTDHRRTGLAEAAGTTVQCAVLPGIAAASVLLTLRLEIGAAVVLVLLVSAYEVGDYLVGTGASTAFEGPLAGLAALGVVGFALGALQVPPFDGADIATFAALAAVACPLGQLLGSAALPAADAPAPALRRLDSLLLLAPAWAFAVGLYLEQV